MLAAAEIRFDGWTLRRPSGELEKDGIRVRLQEQPLQLLEELLAHPGELVSREHLIARLWPKGVLEFDTALNSTVRRLRAALGDEAGTPRYIETIPRRGYRFIGSLDVPVTPASTPAADVTSARDTEPAVTAQPVFVEPRKQAAVLALGILVMALVAGPMFWYLHIRRASIAVEHDPPAPAVVASIAVLPFVNLGPEQDQQYFSDGLTEEVLNLLAQTNSLRVIARTSSFQFRDQNVDIATVARKLKVSHVLEGSVRKSGRRIRITAQLIETATSAHLWSAAYDRTLDDPLDVQSDIASAVAGALRVALNTEGVPLGDAAMSRNAQAYEFFLRGRFHLQRQAEGDIGTAREHFERATALDPAFARAWAGLASAHWLQVVEHQAPRDAGLWHLREAAERALALDQHLAEAHMRLANYFWLIGDNRDGDEHMRRAQESEPGNSLVLAVMAHDAASDGRFDQAIELQRRAFATDPLSTASHVNLSWYLYLSGRWAEAKTEEANVLELDPTATPEMTLSILVLERQFEEALALARSGPEGLQQDRFLAMAYFGLGREAEAETALASLIAAAGADAPAAVAEVFAFRGDADRAFMWLQRAPNDAYWVRYSPFLKALHDDPRWAAWAGAPH